MENPMQRRKFLTTLAGGAAWPLVGRAEPPPLPVVGFLNGTSPDPFLRRVAAFREGLAQSGYVERANVAVQYRWANTDFAQLPEFAADLVRRNVAVIAATGGTDAALAAKQATSTIPIVFGIGGDPVAVGLVDNLGRPTGNLTGMTFDVFSLAPRQLQVLRELIPGVATVGVLVNPANPHSQTRASVEKAAGSVGMQVLVLDVSDQIGFDAAFRTLVERHVNALMIGADAYLASQREQIVAAAARYAMPTIYQFREFVDAGGLISYGSSITDGYRQIGAYTGRILKGAKPADLPVMRSTKFELVINRHTARALGLTVPPTLLARADKVIG
jgi:putative ABC transport system substrate-binding protein